MASFISQSTGYEKTTSMRTVHTRYSVVIAEVRGDMEQRAWSSEDLGSLKRRVKEVEKLLLGTFDRCCSSVM